MAPDTKKDVALLVGGWSVEREVSLTKGKDVETALKQAGYSVRVIDVHKDLESLLAALSPKPDVVFNNLYGRGGEDGVIQSVLEMLEIPYTHSGVLASAVAMDKVLTKRLAQSCGVPSPEWKVKAAKDLKAEDPLPRPYVLKPVSEGSSVGVHIFDINDKTFPSDITQWSGEEKILIERFVPGRELTVAVLDGIPQAVTEIRPASGFFDYAAKYR